MGHSTSFTTKDGSKRKFNTSIGLDLGYKLIYFFSWDEWVPPDRLLKMTDENIIRQKQLQQNTPGAAGHGGTGAGTSKAGGSKHGTANNASSRAGARKDGRGTKRSRDDVSLLHSGRPLYSKKCF